jgi:hypothetical protein
MLGATHPNLSAFLTNDFMQFSSVYGNPPNHRVQMSSNQEDVLQYDNLSSMSSNLTICPPIVLLLKTLLNVTFGPPIKQFVLQMSSNLRRKMAGH